MPEGYGGRLLFVIVLGLLFYGDPIFRPPSYYYCWSQTGDTLFITDLITVTYENTGPEARRILAAPLAEAGYAEPVCSHGGPRDYEVDKGRRTHLRSPNARPLAWNGVGPPPSPAEVVASPQPGQAGESQGQEDRRHEDE
ncbi:hypothetical protein DKG75_12660 [Zavarzinia compransoris]|uniref:Uncharacterized protein n=1 Tax=Zavarzinia compransoris TaxID=1264899 RepID=A0A317E173_9PROT|nr:hypothetical protein DKG75_12660 [Zavarzinia compransoris]